jgi:hypothetical protein
MPISVPKTMKSYLMDALTLIKGANTLQDGYTKVQNYLAAKGVPYQTHTNSSSVPSDHHHEHPSNHL